MVHFPHLVASSHFRHVSATREMTSGGQEFLMSSAPPAERFNSVRVVSLLGLFPSLVAIVGYVLEVIPVSVGRELLENANNSFDGVLL